MKYLLLGLTLLPTLLRGASLAEIPLDAPWKKTVHEFTEKNLAHSAWGLAHSQRDYLLSLKLAEKDGVPVDRDVLFAAAFLHDMGGFPPYEKPNVDHAVRSAELVESILVPAGFPKAKIPAVQAAVLSHSYYDPNPPTTPEGIVLHDADTIDFMGVLGIARIISLTQREAAAPTLRGAIAVLEKMHGLLFGKLVGGPFTKQLGATRIKEMGTALALLKAETLDFRAL